MVKEINETYEFTLVLKNVDDTTSKLEDSLYEAGCDDALINFRDGTVYLDFHRKSKSLKEAVIKAIKEVESASINAIVAYVTPEDWVTESDIAKRLDCSRQTVSLWCKRKRRKSFPKPLMKLSYQSPFWKWRDIVEWLYENKLIGKNELEKAVFLENMNAALEERNRKIRNSIQSLLKEIQLKDKTDGEKVSIEKKKMDQEWVIRARNASHKMLSKKEADAVTKKLLATVKKEKKPFLKGESSKS